ncbi:hypothetical protein ACERK3_15740 [Phycisphaerales bacterium AB-hyl4]|uniref:DUF4190 domain-containing protein n=1 Tax=Natronomicrosphaera hydrolytica TaxID=3242702 RepID=A0ABV4UAV1_9BACT
MTNEQNDTPTSLSSPYAYGVGWLSLGLALAGIILICMGDPFWLGLPSSAAAAWSGRCALRHGQDQHAGAHLGLYLGVFNLVLWMLLIVFMQYILGMDVSSLFEIPGQNGR